MFLTAAARFVEHELTALRDDEFWHNRWSPALAESPAGCPPPYAGLGTSSANLIHHAYHVLMLERAIDKPITDLEEVVEFGGGYGSFARLFRKLGFAGGYHVYDFPELNALQRYYVASVAAAENDSSCGAQFVATDDQTGLPTPGTQESLFVALWSLSETPAPEREPWIQRIHSASYVLIAFQEQFEDVDNRRWFESMQATSPSHAWSTWEIPHLPGNHYLIGSAPSTGA